MPELPAAGQTVAVTLEGAAGRIQAALAMPAHAAVPSGVAVIGHPHPLYGGSMDNKVVTTLARCCTEAGLAALRFNFRGVGASEGHFDQGEGETEDMLAALDWSLAATGARQHVLMGFSFGGLVAVRAAAQRRPAQLVTVAPALHYLAGNALAVPDSPWLLIHGRDDDVVDCADTIARVRNLQPPVDVRLLDGVGHFYHGRLGDLRDIVTPVLRARWTELAAR
ncbi:MAG: alpha/beta hydrolase [Nevskiales bacterium]